jgi:hypothetical protein
VCIGTGTGTAAATTTKGCAVEADALNALLDVVCDREQKDGGLMDGEMGDDDDDEGEDGDGEQEEGMEEDEDGEDGEDGEDDGDAMEVDKSGKKGSSKGEEDDDEDDEDEDDDEELLDKDGAVAQLMEGTGDDALAALARLRFERTGRAKQMKAEKFRCSQQSRAAAFKRSGHPNTRTCSVMNPLPTKQTRD